MSAWSRRLLVSVVVGSLASWSVHASGGCDASFVRQYDDVRGVVNSLRPDKGGQMRVYATDGSEFTAGQARWMQGRLGLVDDACVRGDPVGAARLLNDVQQLIQTHRRGS